MTTPTNRPNNLIKITCFEPIYSIMDSYGPICFSKTIGVNDEEEIPQKESVSKAIEENPRNGSLTLPPVSAVPDGPLSLALMTRKFWLAGRELKIGFQGGSTWQKVGKILLRNLDRQISHSDLEPSQEVCSRVDPLRQHQVHFCGLRGGRYSHCLRSQSRILVLPGDGLLLVQLPEPAVNEPGLDQ